MQALPPEIFVLIGQKLQLYPTSLLSLCLVNTVAYQLLYPVLYQHVRLNSSNAVLSFCHAVTSSQPRSAKHTLELKLGDFTWEGHAAGFRMCRDFVPHLRGALEIMPNLRSLSLATTPKALVLLLNDFKPPFDLVEFAHSGGLSVPLTRFLVNQPSITEIAWYATMHRQGCESLRNLMLGNSGFLPQLKKLTGPLYIMAALATSRPVVDITILDHSHTDWNRLFKSLTQTTAPVTSVRLAVPGHTWQQWEAFISQSRSTQLCSTLTEIRVAETLPVSTFVLSSHEFLIIS